ncbi:unnamed protein product [Brassica rapa subsp. trilocularis]|uniref:(rape) hypothetical protein n=1 Tax=Brassica napus TaxID=3708 RepID=A0A816WIK0_BRANA|nr:unnamed protein product [Brassica napus]
MASSSLLMLRLEFRVSVELIFPIPTLKLRLHQLRYFLGSLAYLPNSKLGSVLHDNGNFILEHEVGMKIGCIDLGFEDQPDTVTFTEGNQDISKRGITQDSYESEAFHKLQLFRPSVASSETAMSWFVWIYLVPYEFSVMYCDRMVVALLIAYIKYLESRMCGRGGQIKSWCSCEPTRKTNKGATWERRHREMLRIKRRVSVGYSQGMCKVLSFLKSDDESVGEDKVEFAYEMLCLEDLPESESKTVKRLWVR